MYKKDLIPNFIIFHFGSKNSLEYQFSISLILNFCVKMMNEKLNLKWHSHADHFQEVIGSLYSSVESSDVTLVCDDQVKFKAHKFVLKSCSPVFKSILEEANETDKAIVYLRGVNQAELGTVLEFIYLGQAALYQERMNEFLKLGKDLQIKQLKEVQDEVDQNEKESEVANEEIVIDNNDYIVSFEENELASGDDIPYNNSEIKAVSTEDLVDKVSSIISSYDTTCPQCGKVFTQRASMMQHVREIHEGKKFPCNMCSYQATRSSNLTQHKLRVHKLELKVKENKDCI